jgi:hypothetical protein
MLFDLTKIAIITVRCRKENINSLVLKCHNLIIGTYANMSRRWSNISCYTSRKLEV